MQGGRGKRPTVAAAKGQIMEKPVYSYQEFGMTEPIVYWRRAGETMSTKIYVGNLAYGTTENEMQEMFSQHGSVRDIDLIVNKLSGDFRGFGFVTMNYEDDAKRAIEALNGTMRDGQFLKVVGNLRHRNPAWRGGN